MCGIFAYIGPDNAFEKIFEGLKSLDYRGYDSWGIGVIKNHKIFVKKKAGKINSNSTFNFSLLTLNSRVGIGHTRWATHGAVNDVNAHPHYSTDKSFILAQNGIVENYEELKKILLKKGYQFQTETDTEVIVRLIEEQNKKAKKLEKAARIAFQALEGRNTIIILSQNGAIIALRNGSPLVLGLSNNGIYLSSDTLSFAPYVDKILVVDNGQMVICTDNKICLKDIKSGKSLPLTFENNTISKNRVGKDGFPHFTLKEIYEAPSVIKKIISQDKKSYQILADAIYRVKNVYTIGSGTAGASAAQIAFYLRTLAKINAISLIGAESREYFELFTKDDLIIAPSQSGETADVLEVLEAAKNKGVKICSFVNMQGSMMTRMSDYKFMAGAGPEISVISTKVFVSQISWGYLIAKTVQGKYEQGLKNLSSLSENIDKLLKNKDFINKIKSLAQKLAKTNHIFLLAKSQNKEIIKEGMVKIIESSYVHAHAIPAGDLKHYAITIIEKGIPVIFVISNDNVKKDVFNAVNEVKARGAEIIGISPENHKEFDTFIKVPDQGEVSAIINIIPLQLLAYYMAVEKGNDVDKPRNIAKSVTVK